MNILLTGGAGYIGSHTAVFLADSGYEIVLMDNFSNSRKKVIERIERIIGKKIICIDGDIRDTPKLKEILEKFQIQAVIHFAGLKAVGESQENPLDYYDNNVSGSISLLLAMRDVGVKNIVFSSSATVYGNPQYLPYDEDHPLNPINPYGRTKWHVEQILRDVCNSDPAWKVALLRYFNPVGAHDSGLIGEAPNGVPNNLMPYLTQVANGKLPHLNVFGGDYETRDGTGERDYIHVMDLARGHLAALDYLKSHAGCHEFNLGTGNSVSVLELVRAYENASGSLIPIQLVQRRPGDLPICYADSSKAKKLLSWSAVSTISDMCESTAKWSKKKIKRNFRILLVFLII